MGKDKWAKSTDRIYLFCLPDSKKREGEGPFGVPPSARVLSPARKNFCSDRTETMTYRCPRQMEHKAYGAQPASVRHQGNPFSIKDSRTRPRLPTKNRNHLQGSWFPASHRGAQQPEARKKRPGAGNPPVPGLASVSRAATSPARTTAGTASQRKAINVPCPVILPNKSFWKGWGELEGGRETFFQKGSPFPPHSRTSTSPTRSSRNAWSSPHRAGRARGLPERRGNP